MYVMIGVLDIDLSYQTYPIYLIGKTSLEKIEEIGLETKLLFREVLYDIFLSNGGILDTSPQLHTYDEWTHKAFQREINVKISPKNI